MHARTPSALSSALRAAKSKTLKTSAVVLDIGDTLIKCGFAGEACPRIITKTNLSVPSNLTVLPTSNPIVTPQGSRYRTAASDRVRPTAGNGSLPLKVWIEVLAKQVKAIYFEHLQINPRDRRVFICENPFWPYVFKTALAIVLFDLGVPGIIFVSGSALPMYALGENTGIVLDIGYTETRILPLVEGFPLDHLAASMPLGMNAVYKNARTLLLPPKPAASEPVTPAKDSKDAKKAGTVSAQKFASERAAMEYSTLATLLGDETVMENIVARTCFVRSVSAIPWPVEEEVKQKVKQDKAPAKVETKEAKKEQPKAGSAPAKGAATPAKTTEQPKSAAKPAEQPKPDSKDSKQPSEAVIGAEYDTVTYRVNSDVRLQITGAARARAADALFGDNEEGLSIAELIAECLLRVSSDLRPVLIRNLLVCGGTAELPGLKPRLLQEVNNLLTSSRYRELRGVWNKVQLSQPLFQPCILSWVGGSLLGAIDISKKKFLTKDEFESRCFRVPDWTSVCDAAAIRKTKYTPPTSPSQRALEFRRDEAKQRKIEAELKRSGKKRGASLGAREWASLTTSLGLTTGSSGPSPGGHHSRGPSLAASPGAVRPMPSLPETDREIVLQRPPTRTPRTPSSAGRRAQFDVKETKDRDKDSASKDVKDSDFKDLPVTRERRQ